MTTTSAFVLNATHRARGARSLFLCFVLPSMAGAACVVPVGDGQDEDEVVQVREALKGACESAVACDPPLSAAPPPGPLPDLVGSPFHRGPQPAVTVTNRGTATAPASSTYVDIGWGCRQHLTTPAIAAGSAIQVATTLPDRCYRAGATMTIVVDEYQAISESDETNNTRTHVFGILGTPSP